jgi:hypothetical protein
MMRWERALGATVLTVLIAAGCGGEGEIEVSGSTATEAAPDAETATDEAAPDEAAASEDATEAPDEAATEVPTEATEEESFEGTGSGDWCSFATDVEAASDDLDDADFTNPDTLRDLYREFGDQLERAEDVVPPEIEADFALIAENFRVFLDALEAVDYDFLQVDQAVLAELDSEALATASENIERYNEEVCGIPADTDDLSDDGASGGDEGSADGATSGDEGVDEVPSGTVQDAVVAALMQIGLTEEQAVCLIDALGPDALGGDPTSPAFLDAFESCGIDPATLG